MAGASHEADEGGGWESGPPTAAAPSLIDMDIPALTFRCEHVNAIAGAVFGMGFKTKHLHFAEVIVTRRLGLSLHDDD